MLVILGLALILAFLIFRMPTTTISMKYSQVLSYFKDQKVKSFTYDLNDGELTIVMSAEDAKAAIEETQKLNGVQQIVSIGGFGIKQSGNSEAQQSESAQKPGRDTAGHPGISAAMQAFPAVRAEGSLTGQSCAAVRACFIHDRCSPFQSSSRRRSTFL